jgi:hypothetical protein
MQTGCNFSRGFAAAAGLAFLAATPWPAPGESVLGDPEERIIGYENSETLSDPVSLLKKRLAEGKTHLTFEPGQGYLRSLLETLRIPRSSQALVFSKTSSQSAHVSPRTPRALYFNEDTYVAWAPDAPTIDLASVDPTRGPIFYTLRQADVAQPQFSRRNECLQCHLGPMTRNVPGLVVKSVYTACDGTAVAAVDDFVNGHNSALEQRWGGWYVTGTHSGAAHLGNIFVAATSHLDQIDVSSGANVTDLGDRFEHERYLSRHSDLVALLVLEHQVGMQNLITHANYEASYALDELARRSAIEARANDPYSKAVLSPNAANTLPGAKCAASALAPGCACPAADWPHQRMAMAGEMLLEYMLFRNEALLHGAVKGTSDFAVQFQQTGPRASDGRSLRQLDLHTRLFRYPCSFLIYSDEFDALPQTLKSYLWERLHQILTGQDRREPYDTLSREDRKNVLEILRETKPEFAAWLGKRPIERN